MVKKLYTLAEAEAKLRGKKAAVRGAVKKSPTKRTVKKTVEPTQNLTPIGMLLMGNTDKPSGKRGELTPASKAIISGGKAAITGGKLLIKKVHDIKAQRKAKKLAITNKVVTGTKPKIIQKKTKKEIEEEIEDMYR